MSIWKKSARLAAPLVLVASGLVLGLAVGGGQTAIGTEPQQTSNAAMASDSRLADMVPQAAFVDVADNVGPAVVFIQATRPREGAAAQGQDSRFQDFFQDFFGRDPEQAPEGAEPEEDFNFQDQAQSQGSGVLISADGYILTNAHVIAELDIRDREMDLATAVQVTLQDDRLYDAEIVGADLGTDIALLKINGRRLPFAELGDSDALRVGEWVMAIGAPFGLQNTVSAGIVSAIGRANLAGMITPYQDFVQTDAAINPGNSGGPLVNLRGEIIGINTAIATGGGFNPSFNGVGFAVPVNMVRRVADHLRDHGRVLRGYLGVSVQGLSRDDREAFDLGRRDGAIISTVNDGGPADQAGIQEADIVIGVDGEALENRQDFLQRIAEHGPGDEVELEVVRFGDADGSNQLTITVTLSERPPEAEVLADQYTDNRQPARSEPEGSDPEDFTSDSALSLGIRVTELTDEIRRRLEIDEAIDGVVVTDVAEASPAAQAGIQPGDVIRRVRTNIESVRDFDEQFAEFGPGDAVPLRVYSLRGQASTFLALRIPR
ncbi:MAG: PDZ domain-containing protein [Acidobacteria bacterium]|nr:PDZ domain-containing protein [Acidobacteriota bacterium]